MIYRPKFCCNCGEKIERSEWKLWTSGRFCELCETEYKVRDMASKTLAITGIFIGIIGLASYFRGPSGQAQLNSKRELVSRSQTALPTAQGNLGATRESQTQSQQNPASVAPANQLAQSAEVTGQAGPQKLKALEPVYFCRAETKKGTPCSRRVKAAGERCWQHAGMPAMTTMEKSRTGK